MTTPALLPVVILNDDVTSFEQIIQTIRYVFGLDDKTALDFATTIHTEGRAVMGYFIEEIAETKVSEIEYINDLNDMNIQVFIDDEEHKAIDMLTSRIKTEILQDPTDSVKPLNDSDTPTE